MPDSRLTAVVGAGGAQGGAVARALRDAGRPCRVLSRNAETVGGLVARGAEHAPADLLDPVTVARALDGVGGAFVMIPFDAPPDVHARYVDTVLDALRSAGAPQTVFTLSGPVPAEETGAPSLDARRAAARKVAESGLPPSPSYRAATSAISSARGSPPPSSTQAGSRTRFPPDCGARGSPSRTRRPSPSPRSTAPTLPAARSPSVTAPRATTSRRRCRRGSGGRSGGSPSTSTSSPGRSSPSSGRARPGNWHGSTE